MEVYFALLSTSKWEKKIITKASKEMKQGMAESSKLKWEAKQWLFTREYLEEKRNLSCYVASVTSRPILYPMLSRWLSKEGHETVSKDRWK